MLPQVSSALTKSISPIGTSIGAQPEFIPWKNPREKKSKPSAKAKDPEKKASSKLTLKIVPPPPPPPSGNIEVASFAHLLDLLGDKDQAALKNLGTELYEVTVQNQKKMGRSLKGAILDTFI